MNVYKPYFLAPNRLTEEDQEDLFEYTSRDGISNLYQVLWEDLPRQTLSEGETTALKIVGVGTKLLIATSIVLPHIEK